MTADVARRDVLAGMVGGLTLALTGGSLLALGGCARSQDAAVASQDQAALDEVLAGELALETQALATPGTIAAQAAQAHRAHADAMVAAGGVATATPAPTASPGATTTTAPPPIGTGTAASLAIAQQRQADGTARLALGATDRIAQLLASIAASDASFSALLVSRR